jgi:transcriptional regulator with GAF, ATPase, and Fis domain
MRTIFGLLERIVDTDATVLFLGETGTGKDLLARALHDDSPRAGRPFVVVDCGAVAPSLIESELFGHERGAFTGAAGQRQGAFEAAAGGTVFLDEIGELPLDLQPKLLRVLEQREVRRVGGNKTISVDIRILAATRKDLDREVAANRFREDLYFRLAVVPVTVPPLRERRDDIPLLVDRFLEALTRGAAPSVPAETMAALGAHDWPGNVRELRNVLERALYLNPDRTAPLRLAALPSAPSSSTAAPPFDPALSYGENRERAESAFERAYLEWLLRRAEGNVSEAARQAKMDRKYLHKLLKKHGLGD